MTGERLADLTRWRLLAAVAVAAGLALSSVHAPSAQAARGLQLGFTDPVFTSNDANLRSTWLTRAQSVRANTILLAVAWSGVAPGNPPPGFEASNPADPAYNFATLD